MFVGLLASVAPADAAEDRPLTCVGPTRQCELDDDRSYKEGVSSVR
jgi:hypothetical protein